MNIINNNINSNKNLNFGNIYATKKGAVELLETFKDREYLQKLVAHSKNNLSADIYINDNEIIVKPHELTNRRIMRMHSLYKGFNSPDYYPEGYMVDYFAHDIYPAAENAFYAVDNRHIPGFPQYKPKGIIYNFGKLFLAACHIAADLDYNCHKIIAETLENEKNLSMLAEKLGITITDNKI